MVEKIKQAWLDHKVQKWISRKLFVLGLASYYLHIDKIDGDIWSAIALGYIGLEGVAKIANSWKHGLQ